MTRRAVGLEELRVALRRMSRRNLLIVAERAAKFVPRAKLWALVLDAGTRYEVPGAHGASVRER